jgi:hypothetical protein
MILIGVLEAIGSVRSPTVTVRYLEPVAKASRTVFCRDEVEQRYPRVGNDGYGLVLRLVLTRHIYSVPPLVDLLLLQRLAGANGLHHLKNLLAGLLGVTLIGDDRAMIRSLDDTTGAVRREVGKLHL